jgi:hypothetical protein
MFAVPANFDGIFQSRKLARLVLDTWLKLQCAQSWLPPWCDRKQRIHSTRVVQIGMLPSMTPTMIAAQSNFEVAFDGGGGTGGEQLSIE